MCSFFRVSKLYGYSCYALAYTFDSIESSYCVAQYTHAYTYTMCAGTRTYTSPISDCSGHTTIGLSISFSLFDYRWKGRRLGLNRIWVHSYMLCSNTKGTERASMIHWVVAQHTLQLSQIVINVMQTPYTTCKILELIEAHAHAHIHGDAEGDRERYILECVTLTSMN